MSRYRVASDPVWLKNWRYPPPPPLSNFSSILGFKIVAVKVRFPPYDSAEAEDSASISSSRFSEYGLVEAQQRAAAFVGHPLYGGEVTEPVTTSGMVTEIATISAMFSAQIGKNIPYSTVILMITLLLICTSILTIYIIATMNALKNVIGHFLLSLAFTDLLTGILVTPIALYASLAGRMDEQDRALCRAETYFELTLYSTNAYVFVWIGVDRYAALKRPSRYEVEQTLTRCKCWIAFTWITASLLCCPALFGDNYVRYQRHSFLCMLDWGRMAPYTIALVVLVLAPSFITVTYSYAYIGRKLHNPNDSDEGQKCLLETDSSYIVTLFVVLFHFVSWAPWFGLKFYEALVLKHDLPSRPLHFSLLWLAIGGANWKIFIYTSLNVAFRNRLREVFRNLVRCSCIRRRSAYVANDGDLDGLLLPPFDQICKGGV